MNKKDLKAGLYGNDYFEEMVNTILELFKSPEENGSVPTKRARYSDSLTDQFRYIPSAIDHGVNQESVNPEHKKRLDHLSELHTVKNAKYGKSFDRGLDKHGVISWIVRDEDKENRMLELFDQCIKKDEESGRWYFDGSSLDGNDESLSDTLLDRANYLIMLDMWIKQLPIKRYKNIYADNMVFDTLSTLEERDTDDSKDKVDYEAHARKKFLTNSIYNKALLEKRKEGIRKPISQEEWASKLYLGWSDHDLEKMFYVSESDEQYEKRLEEWKRKQNKEECNDGKQTRIRGYI